jgi:hypothetical protein
VHSLLCMIWSGGVEKQCRQQWAGEPRERHESEAGGQDRQAKGGKESHFPLLFVLLESGFVLSVCLRVLCDGPGL